MKEIIPMVDLSSTFSDNSENWSSVAGKLVEALHDPGFVYLTGHGIDLELVDRAFEASKSFFELPLPIKCKYVSDNTTESYAGFFEAKDERKPGMQNFEYKECFNVDLSRPFLPPEPPEFRPIMTEFLDACHKLKDRVFRLLATGLGIEDVGDFLSMMDHKGQSRNQTNFRMAHYPTLPAGKEVPEEMVRCGEHSDCDGLTFVFQDDVGGLEAKATNDKWLPVTPIPGSVVVNVGEMLEKLTAGYLRATPHRILITPEDGKLYKDRYSLVFFVSPNDETVLKPIKSNFLKLSDCANGEDCRWITAAEHFLWRKQNHADSY